jgi:hypothetical protein
LRRLDVISVLTLVLSAGALVITAVGTGSVKPADDKPPSSPVVIDADGYEVGALSDAVDSGKVGVMLIDITPEGRTP